MVKPKKSRDYECKIKSQKVKRGPDQGFENKELQEKEAQLSQAHTEIQQIQNELNDKHNKIQSQNKKIKILEQEIEKRNKIIRDIKKQPVEKIKILNKENSDEEHLPINTLKAVAEELKG